MHQWISINLLFFVLQIRSCLMISSWRLKHVKSWPFHWDSFIVNIGRYGVKFYHCIWVDFHQWQAWSSQWVAVWQAWHVSVTSVKALFSSQVFYIWNELGKRYSDGSYINLMNRNWIHWKNKIELWIPNLIYQCSVYSQIIFFLSSVVLSEKKKRKELDQTPPTFI